MKNIYSEHLAEAKLDIKQATAGHLTNCKLQLKVGKYGIADGGALKVLFRISADVDDVQFTNPEEHNYVSFETSANAELIGYSRHNGLKGKVHARPWTNGFVVFIKGGYINQGEIIQVLFKNFRMQTIVEDTFEFKVVVDAFATGEYTEIESSPEITIVPDKPNKIVALLPTISEPNAKTKGLVKLEDKWGNPCTQINDSFSISNAEELGVNKSQKFSLGKSDIELSLTEGQYQLQAKYKGLEAVSNFILIQNNTYKHYWADLHGQSEETVGTNNIEHYINFAKEYGFLDVISSQANDFQVDKSFWEKTIKHSHSNTKEGEFVMFPGYEWSGNTGRGGDRNVIFNEQKPPIYKSSFAQTLEEFESKHEAIDVPELFSKLKKHKAFTIAHVGGRYANLDMHDDQVEPLIEVHSDWGTFEWYLHQALEKDYMVGISAASDNHNSRPGASYPGLEEFTSYGGLTCILSEELTPDAIYKAITSRHVYATTGHRAYLDCSLKADAKEYMIGDQVKSSSTSYKLALKYLGKSNIEKIEMFNKSKLIETFAPSVTKSKVKLSWHGTEFYGRNREYKWDGKGIFKGNQIVNSQAFNFYHHSKYTNDQESFSFKSLTSGNYKGIIFDLDSEFKQLDLDVNGNKFNFNGDSANNIHQLNEYSALELTYLPKNQGPEMINQQFTINKSDLAKKNALYLKITEVDGGITWSSPFYIQ